MVGEYIFVINQTECHLRQFEINNLKHISVSSQEVQLTILLPTVTKFNFLKYSVLHDHRNNIGQSSALSLIRHRQAKGFMLRSP